MSETENSGGLLDGVSAEAETETNGTTAADTEISHIAADPSAEDNEPLERPDWWPEKFWSKDANEPEMEKLANAYAELEKKFRAGGHKAPEEYSTEVFGNTPTDDPVVKTYMDWATKYGISQEAFNDLAGSVLEQGGLAQEQAVMNVKAEKEALGPNADAIIKGMATWGNGLVQKGILSGEDYEEFKIMGGTAAGIRVFQKIRAAYEGRVPTETVKPEGIPSKDELYDMVAKPEYKTDPAYRKKVEKLFEQAFGEAA